MREIYTTTHLIFSFRCSRVVKAPIHHSFDHLQKSNMSSKININKILGYSSCIILLLATIILTIMPQDENSKSADRVKTASYILMGLTGLVFLIFLLRLYLHGRQYKPGAVDPHRLSNQTLSANDYIPNFPSLRRRDSNLSATFPWSSSQSTLE